MSDRDSDNSGDEAPRSKRLKTGTAGKEGKKLIVVLENANLETAKIGQNYELLNSDKHVSFLKKHGKDPANYRPDITHQCLLMLLDSPLNRSNLLKIYVHTNKNVLIEINPQTRIPRTFERFCGLMVQLLHKLSIRASDSAERLLKVIKNPVESHLPIGCKKVGTSCHVTKFLDVKSQYADNKDEPIVFVIGAMAKGKVSVDYIEDEVKLSDFPLSGALTCAKLTTIFEDFWSIR